MGYIPIIQLYSRISIEFQVQDIRQLLVPKIGLRAFSLENTLFVIGSQDKLMGPFISVLSRDLVAKTW